MRYPDDHFAARQRSIQRFTRAIMVLSVVIMILAVVAAWWAAAHPEAIGGFMGRIAAGFREAR